jgi:cyclase
VGGGIRCVEDMREAMNAGADKVSVCTSALENPALLSEMARAYGSQCVVLSIDAKRVEGSPEKPRWTAWSHGGRRDTGIDAVAWAARAVELGAGEILLNSIDADGTGQGYDLELTRIMLDTVPVPVIASGGAGNLDQIAGVLLSPGAPGSGNDWGNADAALVASLLHFGTTTIREIKRHAASRGVCVRW